jgi:DNA-binding MarR family transcriptional regulator
MGTLIAKGLVERSRIGTAKEQNTLYVLTEDGKKRAELVDAEEKDPASAAVHAMAKDISSAVTFSGTSGESWFTTDLREKITGKIGLSEDEANELKTNLEKSKLSGEDNKRKQLASIILALHKKGGQKAIDSAVKRAKTPAEILDMVATLRSTDLMPQAN